MGRGWIIHVVLDSTESLKERLGGNGLFFERLHVCEIRPPSPYRVRNTGKAGHLHRCGQQFRPMHFIF